MVPILDLPTDHPRPAVPSHQGGRVALVIPVEVTRRLRQLMAASHTTMFMALLAAFKLLLYRFRWVPDVPCRNASIPPAVGGLVRAGSSRRHHLALSSCLSCPVF